MSSFDVRAETVKHILVKTQNCFSIHDMTNGGVTQKTPFLDNLVCNFEALLTEPSVLSVLKRNTMNVSSGTHPDSGGEGGSFTVDRLGGLAPRCLSG